MLHFQFKTKTLVPSNTLEQQFQIEKYILQLMLSSNFVPLLNKIVLGDATVRYLSRACMLVQTLHVCRQKSIETYTADLWA